MLQGIEHAISLVGKDGSRIEEGKVGRTTSTFYPSAGTSAPMDAGVRADLAAGGVSWSTIHGTNVGNNVLNATNLPIGIRGGTTSGKWRQIIRGIVGFNTSSISDTDVISSATFSAYPFGTDNPTAYGTPDVVLDRNVPASASNIVAGDYYLNNWDVQLQSDTSHACTSFTSGSYLDYTLNSTGLSNIDVGGYSWIGPRLDVDFNNAEPTWANNTETNCQFYGADQSGTSQDPKLVVEHVASNPPTSPHSLKTEGQTNPTGITDSTPEFTAVYVDPDATDVAHSYQIQVGTTTSVGLTTFWDSGKTTLASSTPQGTEIAPISYAGSTLSTTTVYYWRIKFWDAGNVEGAWSTTTASFTMQESIPPTEPSALKADGQTNPTDIENLSFDFSAIFNDPESEDIATAYRIQVASTSSSFATTTWDSGQVEVASTTPGGERVLGMTYQGSALIPNHTYYWRVKFWDTNNQEGPWSTTTASFATAILSYGGTIQDIYFTYDDVGNILTLDDYGGTAAARQMLFEYDDLYRLVVASTTAASSTPFREEYEYTSIGNIASTSANGAYTYGEVGYANPHAATLIDGTALTYDQNGNLTSYGTDTFLYDYRNRLATSSDGSATTTYAYDHTFERVLKTSGGTTTYYPNDLYETDGTTATRYIFANGELVATMEATGAATTTTFIHPDHLGGTNVATDESGQVSQVLDYYPYGSTRIDTGSYDAKRTFTGHEYDSESGLIYADARYYEQNIGRWLVQDPVAREMNLPLLLADPQQHNHYSYGRNNPLAFIDPDGELVELVTRQATPDLGPLTGMHMYYRLTPDNPADSNLTLPDGVPTGSEQVLLSAFPEGPVAGTGVLKKSVAYSGDGGNKPSTDSQQYAIQYSTELIAPNGMSDTDFINLLSKEYDELEDGQLYSPLGRRPGNGILNYASNSNNFAYTLGHNVGVGSQVSSFARMTPGITPGSNTSLAKSLVGILKQIKKVQKGINQLKAEGK